MDTGIGYYYCIVTMDTNIGYHCIVTMDTGIGYCRIKYHVSRSTIYLDYAVLGPEATLMVIKSIRFSKLSGQDEAFVLDSPAS